MDETTFDLWDTKRNTWMAKNRGFTFSIAPTRGKNHTLYMAIGNCLTVPYVYIIKNESTNSEKFKIFVNYVKDYV